MNKLTILFFVVSFSSSLYAEPNRYGKGVCVTLGDGIPNGKEHGYCISDIDPNGEAALNLKKLASESRGEKDFSLRLKERALEMQVDATQKYKKGSISKNEYVEVAMQVGAIAEYVSKSSESQTKSEPLKPKIVSVNQKFEIGSPDIFNISDEELKKLENKDIPLLRKKFNELVEVQKKSSITQVDLRCESKNDCVALSIGNKLCGGPVGYLVISKLDPNFSSTNEKLAKLTEADRKFQSILRGFASTCSYETPPQIDCRSNCCVIP